MLREIPDQPNSVRTGFGCDYRTFRGDRKLPAYLRCLGKEAELGSFSCTGMNRVLERPKTTTSAEISRGKPGCSDV